MIVSRSKIVVLDIKNARRFRSYKKICERNQSQRRKRSFKNRPAAEERDRFGSL